MNKKKNRGHEDCGHVVCRNWCAVCVKGRCVVQHLQAEPLEEEERERTTPMVAFDLRFLWHRRIQTHFQILICRDNRHGQIPLLSLLVDFIKDLDSSANHSEGRE